MTVNAPQLMEHVDSCPMPESTHPPKPTNQDTHLDPSMSMVMSMLAASLTKRRRK